jgi:hypothetical protein
MPLLFGGYFADCSLCDPADQTSHPIARLGFGARQCTRREHQVAGFD